MLGMGKQWDREPPDGRRWWLKYTIGVSLAVVLHACFLAYVVYAYIPTLGGWFRWVFLAVCIVTFITLVSHWLRLLSYFLSTKSP